MTFNITRRSSRISSIRNRNKLRSFSIDDDEDSSSNNNNNNSTNSSGTENINSTSTTTEASAVATKPTTTTTVKIEDDHVVLPPPSSSQVSDEDEHIHQLERSGALRDVIGSQSMLSQELHALNDDYDESSRLQFPSMSQTPVVPQSLLSSQREYEDEEDEEEENDHHHCDSNKVVVKEEEEQVDEDEDDDEHYEHMESQDIGIGMAAAMGSQSHITIATNDDSVVMVRKFGLLGDHINNNSRTKKQQAKKAKAKTKTNKSKKHSKTTTTTTTTSKPSSSSFYRTATGRCGSGSSTTTTTTGDSTTTTTTTDGQLKNFPQFGTLLDAVNIFQEQEEANSNLFSKKEMKEDPVLTNKTNNSSMTVATTARTTPTSSPNKRKRNTTTRTNKPVPVGRPSPLLKKQRAGVRGAPAQQPHHGFGITSTTTTTTATTMSTLATAAAMGGASANTNANTTKRPRAGGAGAGVSAGTVGAATGKKAKTNKKLNADQQQEIAQRAAALAQRTINDPDLTKRLLLSMALVRENPRSAPSVLPERGTVVKEGFFWSHFPPLESVLKEHMEEYYELSITKCQSAQQQAFNNELVEHVRTRATEQGWSFDGNCFTSKGLRDRIRCYYKTHIQNAKKRLRTMLKIQPNVPMQDIYVVI